MRHKKAGRKLNRTMEHRKALFRNMSRSLLVHERIRTTLPKAKELRKFVEPLITLALKNDLKSRREAYKVLGSHQLVQRLFDEIGPRFADQPSGGYTRIVKFSQPRMGDAAPMALIELNVRAVEPVADEEEQPEKTEEVEETTSEA
ncbi:50S ribosomal protein L17 [Desulfoplanes formicivorans]|uniref:Large ribosomal subunit protein bL17 n=1 Tax=Desulfoplanes formicivorans TaxID=1592317 RepID=A0A194AE91_9BACT|nr:50S ribosomal protein L17 [Desulfoplanes formicivorans]GAU07520.1 50S ribosomal protein L17 [Desulfoplanes formicivorans]